MTGSLLAVAPAGALTPAHAAAPAGTAPWTVQPSPSPKLQNGVLSAVACPAAGTCEAVGSSGVNDLAEGLRGSSWSLQPINYGDGFAGVSCSAADSCLAVGAISAGSEGERTSAAAWNGTSWADVPTPVISNPSGGIGSSFAGVSCAAANACTAVGEYSDTAGNEVTLAEEWNGTSWSGTSTPDPAGSVESYLSSVSCTSADSCTAVGYNEGIASSAPLVEAYNGTAWSIEPTPAVPTGSALSSVACTAADACIAVGSTGGRPLVEAWNGTTWSIETTPVPPGTDSLLSGVDCMSADACHAVGTYTNGSGDTRTLAEGWDGTAWSIEPSANPSFAGDVLSSVSCTSVEACTAVGDRTTKSGARFAMSEEWDGTAWSSAPTPTPTASAGAVLSAVACATADACFAVGRYHGSSTAATQSADKTLAEEWDGTSWTIVPTPNPPGLQPNALTGVACSSAAACVAVGPAQKFALAEVWNGARWTIAPTAIVRGGTVLSAVSCPAANDCTAVGYSNTGTLAEVWNGTSWSVEPTPDPASDTELSLTGVSCTAADACTAVGNGLTATRTFVSFAERWDGSAWAIEPTPALSAGSSLSSVACPAVDACTAVGSSGGEALAEAWNGSSWSVEATPSPSDKLLAGVACTAADACTAVGSSYGTSPRGTTLAEVWDGSTWSIQKTPDPGRFGGYLLTGVACTAANTCTAVGSTPTRPLVEIEP